MVSALTNFNIINLIAPFHWGEHSTTTRQISIPKIKDFIIPNLTFQTITTVERKNANARHAFRYSDAHKATATLERTLADACYVFRNRDARKTTAAPERPIADAHHAAGNCNARKSFATEERRTANRRDAFRDRDT